MNPVKTIKILLILIGLLFIFSLWNRMPDIDDAWIGEHAYWLSRNGYVKSDLMYGVTQQEDINIVHHKLFNLNGALFILLAGFSLWTLKSVSLFWGVIFLVVYYNYVSKKLSTSAAWFALLLMAVNAFVFQYSFVYRPEIMVMTIGFVSWVFLEKYFSNETDKVNLYLSGLIAGLAAATHLNGLIFIISGGILLLWNRKLVPALLFGISAIPSFSIYFFDFSRDFGINFWLYQITEAPALHKPSDLPLLISVLIKPFREHLRFFHSPVEISLSLLFIFSLMVCYPLLKKERNMLRYLLLLVISLSLITVHTTAKYILLYLPFIIFIITYSSVNIYKGHKLADVKWLNLNGSKATVYLGVLLALFFTANMYHNIEISAKKFDRRRYQELTENYIGSHTDTVSVVAPMDFIFYGIGGFERIQSDLQFADLQKAGYNLSGTHFLEFADSLKIDYLLLTLHYREKFDLDKFSESDYNDAGFEVIGRDRDILVIKND